MEIVFLTDLHIQRRQLLHQNIKFNAQIARQQQSGDSPLVGTMYDFYSYAANFETPFFTFMQTSHLQLIRIACGFLAAYFIVESIFLGPADSVVLLANFNMWGLFITLMSML
jgi:hypothetical protein